MPLSLPRRALPGRALLLALAAAGPVPGETELPPGIALGGPFSLIDQHGARVTEASLRGGWALVYFGYTSCPDICPTELQGMAGALEALPPAEAAQVRPVFITIDPERDTPAVLGRYGALFHPRLLGLTGTPAEVAAVARSYRVFYKRADGEGGTGYLMDHSSIIYLLDPTGAVRALFRSGTPAEDLAAALHRRLG